MNEKISFAGESKLDLDQNNTLNELQKAIDKFFPAPNKYVVVDNYAENDNKISFTISRTYQEARLRKSPSDPL